MASDIVLDIGASTLEATREIAKFQSQATKSLGAVEDSFSSMKKLAIAAVGAFAGVQVVSFLKDCISSAAESQDSFNKLGISMQLAGQYSAESADGIRKFAKELMASTVYEDDAIIAASAHIETLARLDKDGLQRATGAAVDLAAALGIDLNTAAKMVAKASTGNTEAFQRMGIEIKKGATDAESLANTMKVLNERFGGVASAQVNTYSGAVKQASNMWGDFKKAIGEAIIENETVVQSVKSASGFFGLMGDLVVQNKAQIQAWVTDGLVAAADLMPLVLEGLALLVKGFGYVGNAVASVVKYWVAFIRVVTETKVISGIIEGMATVVGMLWSGILRLVGGMVQLAAHIPGVQSLFESMGIDVSGLGDTIGQASEELAHFAINTDFSETLTNGLKAAESTMGTLGDTANTAGEAMGSVLLTSAEYARNAALKIREANEAEKETAKIKGTVIKELEEEGKQNDRKLGILDQIIKAERDLRMELLKQGKTAQELAGIELDNMQEIADRWAESLVDMGMEEKAADALVQKYRELAETKARVADTSASIGGMDKGFWGNIGATSVDPNGNYTGAISKGVLQGATSAAGGMESMAAGMGVAAIPVVGQFLAGVDKLVGVFQALVDFLPGLFDKFANLATAVTDFPAKLLASIQGFVAAFATNLRESLPNLLKTIPQIFDTIISAFADVFPQAIEESIPLIIDAFMGLLEKMPELVVRFYTAYITIFPKLVVALVRAIVPHIPAIAAAFMKAIYIELPKAFGMAFKQALADSAPFFADAGRKIMGGFAQAMGVLGGVGAILAGWGGMIWSGLSASMTQFGSMFAGLGDNIFGGLLGKMNASLVDFENLGGNIFDGFWKQISAIWGEFENMGRNIAVGFQNGMIDFSSITSGGSGGSTGDVFTPWKRWAKGGIVYAANGFPSMGTDTVPAMLTPGEMVIPRDDVGRLSKFLDSVQGGGSSSQPVIVNLKVGENDLAKVMFSLNRNGFRTA